MVLLPKRSFVCSILSRYTQLRPNANSVKMSITSTPGRGAQCAREPPYTKRSGWAGSVPATVAMHDSTMTCPYIQGCGIQMWNRIRIDNDKTFRWIYLQGAKNRELPIIGDEITQSCNRLLDILRGCIFPPRR